MADSIEDEDDMDILPLDVVVTVAESDDGTFSNAGTGLMRL